MDNGAGTSPGEDFGEHERAGDSLIELSTRLERTAEQLRAGQLEPDATLAAIEECARLASEASAQVDQRARAALEPLPDLPGQLPLSSSQ